MKTFFMKICAFFFKRFATANYKYEQLKEPRRMLTGLGIGMGPWLILDVFGLLSNNKSFEFLGMFWILLIIGLRLWWTHGSLKTWLPNGNKVG